MTSRKRRRNTPNQIIRKLAEGHKQLAAGKELNEVCRHLEVAESTWHRWLAQYGGMKAYAPTIFLCVEVLASLRRAAGRETLSSRDNGGAACRIGTFPFPILPNRGENLRWMMTTVQSRSLVDRTVLPGQTVFLGAPGRI